MKESDQTWIYGRYSCRARNRLGRDSIGIEITRASQFIRLIIVINGSPTCGGETGGYVLPTQSSRVTWIAEIQPEKIWVVGAAVGSSVMMYS